MSQMVGGSYIGALEFNATPGSESSATFAEDLSTITVCGSIYGRLTDNPLAIGRKPADMENMERLFLGQTEQGTLRLSELVNLLHSLELNSETSNEDLGRPLKFKKLLLECLKMNPRNLENELDQLDEYLKESQVQRSLIQCIAKNHHEHRNATAKDTPGVVSSQMRHQYEPLQIMETW